MEETPEVKPEEQDTRAPKREGGTPSPLLDFSAAPSPEEKERLKEGVSDPHKPRRGRPPKAIGEAKLKGALVQQFTLIGVCVTPFNQYDGAVIVSKADTTADALVALANENPKVKKALESLLTVSTWSQVIMAIGGMAIPIAANHGLAPAGLCPIFQVPPPPVKGDARRVDDE